MKFEGEHLLPGQIGHFFVLLAFTASIVSSIAFIKTSRETDIHLKSSWLRYARIAFIVQGISIFAVFFSIYYICSNHYFEYLYAYKHASKELEQKYLLACIWEGQEGSFLLWSIWHTVLGILLISKSKIWEPNVLTVISVAQSFLMLMVLGLYFFDVRIGSSPFVLTRNEINGPIFQMPGYLSLIKDGVGLNVLLRNYWMVIHPPILFLGFASTIVPVSFAYAGMVTKKWGEWVKPALPWVLFSACVLGTGIMMGGKWAYESLSFGGFWAWDPVENASLVPWLILVAGLHCMVIYNATGNSLKTAFLFIILANAFVLYSTFLTRTGILGDTSVHSFTESGIAMNILIGIFTIAIPIPMLILFFTKKSHFPIIQKEEDITSREFWMFIGALIFFLASMFIIALTSVPVYNKLFSKNIAGPVDREFAYNKVLILVAVIIGILTGATLYFKYKVTPKINIIRKLYFPIVSALIITIIVALFFPVKYIKQGMGFEGAIYLALFSGIFAAIANVGYIWTILKGNFKAAGSAIAHAGFAIMIIGMLISAGNREVITDNRKTGLYMPFDKDPSGRSSEDPLENLTLLKNVPTQMGNYKVTYLNDSPSMEKNRSFYKLLVQKEDPSGKILERFDLSPDVYKMKNNNLSSNPDIKHYLTHDVFTYISSLPDKSVTRDTTQFKTHEMKIKDTLFLSKGYLILNGILKNPTLEKLHFKDTDTALVADLTIFNKDSSSHRSFPYLSVNNLEINYKDDTLYSQNIITRLVGLSGNNTFKIAVKESDIPIDFVTMKAYVFPLINLVWSGLIIMVSGFMFSIIRRINANYKLGLVVLFALSISLIYMFFIAN